MGGDGPAGPASPADAASDPYDRTACAGTHVADTASIGTVAVTGRRTRGADEERVGFELGTVSGADAGSESESA